MFVKGYTWDVPNNEITSLELSMSGDCVETITPFARLSIVTIADFLIYQALLPQDSHRLAFKHLPNSSSKSEIVCLTLLFMESFSEDEDRFTILSLKCFSHQ
jgi:hypothetical protein